MKLCDFKDEKFIVGVYRDDLIDERMYVIREENEVVVIDPHMDSEIIEDFEGVEKVKIFLTHEHYDHISGVNRLKENFDCEVYATDFCARVIREKENGTSRYPLLFIGDRDKYHYVKDNIQLPYICTADITFSNVMDIRWFSNDIRLQSTPGHTLGSMSILINGKYYFTGDNLLSNGQALKSIDSDPAAYAETVKKYCQMVGKDIWVFPGHGEIGKLDTFIESKERYPWN